MWMQLRVLAALAVLVSAGVHLKLWFDGVRDQTVGAPFLLNAVGGVVIAALLLTWRHWVPPFLALGFGLSTIAAFTIAATVGLLGDHEKWTGGYVWTSLVAEAVAVVAGGLLLLHDNPLRSRGELENWPSVRRAHLN
jgi:hypothetical protein